jgi:hypothetical protein
MNVHPDVARCGSERLAGVDPHSHPHRGRDESALGIGRGSDGIRGSGESDEEGIALRVDLDSAVLGERVSQDAPLLGEDVRIRVTELMEQLRRALDVGEEEGDCAGRQLCHAGQVNRLGGGASSAGCGRGGGTGNTCTSRPGPAGSQGSGP